MGIVIRPSDNVWIKKDNFQIIPKYKINAIPLIDRIRREAINIILYSEIDFAEFYKKHVKKESNDQEYTVLVKNKFDIPIEDEVRNLIKKMLMFARIDWKDTLKNQRIFIDLIKPYKSIVWNSALNGFTTDSTSNNLLFRDIQKLTKRDFTNFKKFLSKQDYAILEYYWQKSFTNEKDVNFIVKSVYFIHKVLVV